MQREALLKVPTVAALPAARAGQLYPWKFASMDYVDQAKAMTQLAGWLANAKNV